MYSNLIFFRPVCANPIGLTSGLPVKPGSATLPMPGYNVQILDEAGQQAGPNQSGQVVIKLPLPPSCLWTVWNNHSRFESGYLATYPGYYLTGDGGYIDQDGYVFIMGRTDDVINVSAHRLSTGEMEEIVGSHPLVAECGTPSTCFDSFVLVILQPQIVSTLFQPFSRLTTR
jgi:propionyl-CoA synthetase